MGRVEDRLEQATATWPCANCSVPKTKADFSRGQLKKGRGSGKCNQCSAAASSSGVGSADSQQTTDASAFGSHRNKRRPDKRPDERPDKRPIVIAAEYVFCAAPAASTTLLDTRAQQASDVPITFETAQRLPPTSSSASVEAARLCAVRALAACFQTECAALGSKYAPHFENWLWAARAESPNSEAAIVPAIPTSSAGSAANRELARRLVHCGMSDERAQAACDALQARAAVLAAEIVTLEKAAEASVTPTNASHGKKKQKCDSAAQTAHAPEHELASVRASYEPTAQAAGGSATLVRLTCGETHVTVSEAHLHKLWTLHEMSIRTQTQGGLTAPSLPAFYDAAFRVLARLISLQGGHELAGGMQAACPPAAFESLRRDLGIRSSSSTQRRLRVVSISHSSRRIFFASPLRRDHGALRFTSQRSLPTLLLRVLRHRRGFRIPWILLPVDTPLGRVSRQSAFRSGLCRRHGCSDGGAALSCGRHWRAPDVCGRHASVDDASRGTHCLAWPGLASPRLASPRLTTPCHPLCFLNAAAKTFDP